MSRNNLNLPPVLSTKNSPRASHFSFEYLSRFPPSTLNVKRALQSPRDPFSPKLGISSEQVLTSSRHRSVQRDHQQNRAAEIDERVPQSHNRSMMMQINPSSSNLGL